MPRILLIEDDHDVRLLMKHALLDGGYKVDAVDSFERGSDLLRRRAYDLVLADGRLPDGTGMALADRAREKGIPALIVTGYAFSLGKDEGVDLAEYNVLLKPVGPHELVEAVARALEAA